MLKENLTRCGKSEQHLHSNIFICALINRVASNKKPRTVAGSVVEMFCNYYAVFLRLAMPTNPITPELNNQAAAGTGTADTPTVKSSPHISAWS